MSLNYSGGTRNVGKKYYLLFSRYGDETVKVIVVPKLALTNLLTIHFRQINSISSSINVGTTKLGAKKLVQSSTTA
ncbi:MAG: hypothetical protein WKF30_09555 [Pyrinomonadaceae bacterium]